MVAASWNMAEAMPWWRISDFTDRRFRRQIVIYFCGHTGSLSEKTAGRQRDSGAKRCQKNFRKKLYVTQNRRGCCLHRLVRPIIVAHQGRAGSRSWPNPGFSGVAKTLQRL